jgi:hypothetical protein
MWTTGSPLARRDLRRESLVNRSRKIATLISSPLLLVAIPIAVLATQVTLPFTFAPNTVADANQVNANFVALRNGINNLHTNGGVVLAGASVNAVVGPTIERSFSNFTGAPAITVSRLGVGQYEVDFGTSVAARFYSGSIGDGSANNVTNATIELTPRAGNLEAVFVEMRDAADALVDSDFWIYIH